MADSPTLTVGLRLPRMTLTLSSLGGQTVSQLGLPGPSGPPGPAGSAGPPGPQGLPGPATWRGPYNPTTQYAAVDAVLFGGASYVATAPTFGVAPPSAPWLLIAAKGADGAQGPQGVAGPSGAAGPQGPKGDPGTGSAGLAVFGPEARSIAALWIGPTAPPDATYLWVRTMALPGAVIQAVAAELGLRGVTPGFRGVLLAAPARIGWRGLPAALATVSANTIVVPRGSIGIIGRSPTLRGLLTPPRASLGLRGVAPTLALTGGGGGPSLGSQFGNPDFEAAFGSYTTTFMSNWAALLSTSGGTTGAGGRFSSAGLGMTNAYVAKLLAVGYGGDEFNDPVAAKYVLMQDVSKATIDGSTGDITFDLRTMSMGLPAGSAWIDLQATDAGGTGLVTAVINITGSGGLLPAGGTADTLYQGLTFNLKTALTAAGVNWANVNRVRITFNAYDSVYTGGIGYYVDRLR